MRVTKPRVAILTALFRHQSPVSIEHIHQELDRNSCDLVTVYRCLAAFEGIGLVRRSFLHNGTSLYELSLGSAPNYHIICKQCGRSEQIESVSVETLEKTLKERGYAELTHVVEFFGVCPDCQKPPVRQTALATPLSRI